MQCSGSPIAFGSKLAAARPHLSLVVHKRNSETSHSKEKNP